MRETPPAYRRLFIGKFRALLLNNAPNRPPARLVDTRAIHYHSDCISAVSLIFHVTGEVPSFCLDSYWGPTGAAVGAVRLTLTNLAGRPLCNFRLAFTAHLRLEADDQLRGASLVRQIFGYHVIAPPADYVLM